MEVLFSNNVILKLQTSQATLLDLRTFVETQLGLAEDQYYFLHQGKRIEDGTWLSGRVHVVPRLVGGKGGFGSMLRAIGAQIEKTTNREACRDLSGRRLRDINEEQRLKNWIATQAEREKEAAEKKKKKLERLCEVPKHEFKDADYDKSRSTLPEKVEDAVTQGLQASCSTASKRKSEEQSLVVKKKPKLWFDDVDISTDDDSDDDNQSNDPETKLDSPKNKEQNPEIGKQHSEVEEQTSKIEEQHPEIKQQNQEKTAANNERNL